MGKRKDKRNRCANTRCGRQFRHADPRAKTCSPACRSVASRARQKEKAEIEAARQEAEREALLKQQREQWLLAIERREAQREAEERAAREAERQAAERQAAEREVEDDPPRKRRRRKRVHSLHCLCGCRREPEKREIVIQMKPHYKMTPLHRGSR